MSSCGTLQQKRRKKNWGILEKILPLYLSPSVPLMVLMFFWWTGWGPAKEKPLSYAPSIASCTPTESSTTSLSLVILHPSFQIEGRLLASFPGSHLELERPGTRLVCFLRDLYLSASCCRNANSCGTLQQKRRKKLSVINKLLPDLYLSLNL